jgi:hypothetical protein
MCLNGTYIKVRIGKICLIVFLSRRSETRRCSITTAFELCSRIYHWEGPGNQVGLKLNGTHELLAYADDVNLLGDIIDTTYI